MKPAALGAAERWEISEDGLVYTFHLRPNGTWSNGDPVTAEDFVYSYQRILSKEVASRYAYMLSPMKNADAYYKGEISDFSQVGVKAIDKFTLQIEVASPTPYLLDLMTHHSWYPVYPPAVEKHGGMKAQINHWTRAQNIVGNGAFKMKEWKLNTFLEVERRDDYWDAENVKLNKVRFVPIDNIESEQRAYRRGAIHTTDIIPPHRVSWVKENFPKEVRIYEYLGVYYYRLNISPPIAGEDETRKKARAALRKKKVRQALSLAIDREAICRFLKGGQKPTTAFVPPGTGGYDPPVILKTDLDQARRLLAEAGYPEGKGFPAFQIIYNTNESHRQIAEILQSQWKNELGIDITLTNQEWKVYNNTIHALDYEMARASWIGDYNDPNTFLDMWLTGGGNNETGYSSAQYDELIKQAALSGSDPGKRFDYFRQAETLLMEDLPVIPIYYYVSQSMVHPSVIGWHDNVMDQHRVRFLDVKRP